MSLIVIALLTSGFRKVQAEYQTYQSMKVEVQATQQMRQQIEQQTIILRRVADDTAAMKRDLLTVTGRAVIRDIGNDTCLRVNSLSRAAKYANMEKARITNLTSSEMPSVVVQIEGTFQNADESWLATLSQHAGKLIDARAGESIKVRIEPAE